MGKLTFIVCTKLLEVIFNGTFSIVYGILLEFSKRLQKCKNTIFYLTTQNNSIRIKTIIIYNNNDSYPMLDSARINNSVS